MSKSDFSKKVNTSLSYLEFIETQIKLNSKNNSTKKTFFFQKQLWTANTLVNANNKNVLNFVDS